MLPYEIIHDRLVKLIVLMKKDGQVPYLVYHKGEVLHINFGTVSSWIKYCAMPDKYLTRNPNWTYIMKSANQIYEQIQRRHI